MSDIWTIELKFSYRGERYHLTATCDNFHLLLVDDGVSISALRFVEVSGQTKMFYHRFLDWLRELKRVKYGKKGYVSLTYTLDPVWVTVTKNDIPVIGQYVYAFLANKVELDRSFDLQIGDTRCIVSRDLKFCKSSWDSERRSLGAYYVVDQQNMPVKEGTFQECLRYLTSLEAPDENTAKETQE